MQHGLVAQVVQPLVRRFADQGEFLETAIVTNTPFVGVTRGELATDTFDETL